MSGLVDLHRHLDGSLRLRTVAELASALELGVPQNLHFYAGMGLSEALARFSFTLSLLRTPAAVRRVASEICEDAQEDGVTDLEIRFAPQLHIDGESVRNGIDVEAILDAALEGVAGRAGVILCGLYGEPPRVLESLVALSAARPGVVGIDLAGGPMPGHRHGLADYQTACAAAKQLGLGVTIHAGEGRPPAEIRQAIEILSADRIGHGTTLLDDPAVVELVKDRGVTIEACVTSNLHVGAIQRIEDHPIARWLELGVRATVCSDNTLLSAVTASSEYALVRSLPGVGESGLRLLLEYGRAARFRRRVR